MFPRDVGPNITGKFGASKGGDNQAFSEGAFYIDVRNKFGAEGSQNSGLHYGFDASRSSDLFSRSTTVQPSSLRFMPLIKT